MKTDISKTGLDLSEWIETRKNNPRPMDGKVIEGFYSLSHKHRTIPELVMARFFLGDRELHRAWGFKQDLHCSFHVLFVTDRVKSCVGCPPVQVVLGGDDSLQYTIDEEVIKIPVKIIS